MSGQDVIYIYISNCVAFYSGFSYLRCSEAVALGRQRDHGIFKSAERYIQASESRGAAVILKLPLTLTINIFLSAATHNNKHQQTPTARPLSLKLDTVCINPIRKLISAIYSACKHWLLNYTYKSGLPANCMESQASDPLFGQ